MSEDKQLTDFMRTSLQHVFILLAILLLSVQAWAAQGYVVLSGSGSNRTLTFKYGTKPTTGTVYNLNTGSSEPGWTVFNTSIKQVVFDATFANVRPTSCCNWFYGCTNLTTITNPQTLKTNAVTTMDGMFYNCSALKTLDVSQWDTGNLKTLNCTFYGCSSLTGLNVSNWNTANLTDLQMTFFNCSSLTVLDVSKWNTANVTTLYSTFYGCSGLTSLGANNVSGWNTANVASLQQTFSGCSSLKALNVSNWNTGKVTSLYCTFYDCSSLTALDVSKWATSAVTTLQGTFYNCSGVSTLDVSKWNTSKVTSLQCTFFGCNKLTELDVSGWKTSEVTDCRQTFCNCNELAVLDVSNWNTGKVTTLYSTFSNCPKLTALDVSRWNTSRCTDLTQTFSGCNNLKELDVSGWDTGNVTKFYCTFFCCRGIKSLDVSNWNTGKMTDCYGTFYGCNGLVSLTFGRNFSMGKAISYDVTFQGCVKLRYLDFYNSDDTDAIKSVDLSSGMFCGVPKTTVIFLPRRSKEVTGVDNVVYTETNGELRCNRYYSEDKVDIEFPYDFKANEAVYTRAMSNIYGSVVLPYAFTTNDNIQAYTLDAEFPREMYFKDIATVPAHTPFAFKNLFNSTVADFTMTDESRNFGIVVHATRSTNSAEYTWDPSTHIWNKYTTEKGLPYDDTSNINTCDGSNVTGWSTKGYYVNETVSDYDGAFYIASDRFYKANGALTMYPHRVTFHGAWTLGLSNNAKSYAVGTGSDLVETAIEAADLRRTAREADAIYDMQGRKVEKLQHGLNIVRMSDGTVRKVISNK